MLIYYLRRRRIVKLDIEEKHTQRRRLQSKSERMGRSSCTERYTHNEREKTNSKGDEDQAGFEVATKGENFTLKFICIQKVYIPESISSFRPHQTLLAGSAAGGRDRYENARRRMRAERRSI